MERHTETISPPVNGKKLPPPPDEPAISPEATDIPPPPDEELDVLIERQSRQKGLYPEQGYEGMAKPQPRQKIVHESIKEYLPRLKEVFPKVKDKNKFIEQLFAGHEFKEGGMNELKDALDETIDFKLPREYNSYESKRAREKSFYDVTKKTDELGFSGRDFEDNGKVAIVEGFIQSNQYNLTDKEKMALRADVLEHIKQKPIEVEAKRRADAIFKQKYGKSPEQVFNTEEIIKGEQTKVVDETRLWVKSENDKLRNYSYTEISNIRGDIENQIASYREQLESQVQSGQLQESDAFNLFNDFQVKKNTEYQQALKNVQSRYIQRFEQIRKNAESKASSRFAERLKDVDEDVRQKAKDYNAIFSEEYSKFSNYVANIRKQMYRSMPLSYIIGSKFHSGIFTTLATTGAALTMAGAENAGDNLTQMANDNLRKLDLPQVTRENIADPVFWAATISESMPFTIATMLPAFATGGLTAIGTAAALRGAGMGALRAATASQIAAKATAGITGWYLEKKLEAGGAYLDALQRGESESEAIEKADFVDRWNNANIVMSIAEMMPAFKIGKATKFKGLRRITESVPFGMSMEGIQDFYQGYGQAKAIDSELSLGEYAKTEDAFVSTVSGTIMGAGFGIYGNLSEKGGSVKTRVISRLVDEGKPVTAAIETAVLNQAVTDEEAKMLADIASLSASARERFDDIDDPAMRVAAITLHSEIGQLQSKLKGDATDDAINKVISEKQKQLSEVINGTAKVIGITIGDGSPLVVTEQELMDMAKDAEFADMFFKGDIKVDFKNTDNKQFLETVKQTYDSQNKTGVQGSEQIGQELVKGQPDQSAGAEKAEAGGVLQTQEGLSSSQGADKAVLEQPSSDTELKKSKAVSVIDNSDFSKEEKESAKEKVSKAKNPVVLFRGKGGKKNIKGEPLNVHPDVKGVFYYEDEQAARHFSRGEGVDMVVVDGTTETVEAPPDTPISKLREVETELINNSKADIVYLKTLDLRGRETQVIVKNPKALVSLDSGEKATLKEGEAALGEKTETEKAEESEKKQVSGVEGKEEMGDMGEKSAADEVTDVAKETPQKEEVVKRESKPEESGLLKEGSLKGYRTAPIKEITTDESRFQGREELDEENVNRIVKEYDERKFDPIVVWKDPNTNRYVVLSGHHRFEAAKRLRLESIPIKEFTGTEQEAIDFAKDSNVLGKQETPIERANRYRKMREDGVSESEIQERARSAHGKDATFILNLSRLHPKGKAISAIRQFDKSTDKSTRSMIEAIADWIGAVKKKYPELSVVQENEMFDYLMLSYSTKNQRGKISTRNQFVDVASAVIERAKYRGNYNEDTFLNFGNVAGKGSLEIEYDGRLEEAKRIESEARKNLDLKRAELISRGATGSQLDKALLPYENALRAAIKDVSEIRASKEAVLRGDMAQINLFEELEQLKHITDENTEREIERIIDEGASKTEETSGDNKQAEKPETANILTKQQLNAEESKAKAEGFKNLTHKINTIRKVNSIADNRRYIQEFTKEEIDRAVRSVSEASDARAGTTEERLKEAREELRRAWNNLNNKSFMYNPKSEAQKHVALDKALLKFAVLSIKKHAGDLVKATQYVFNQLKRITGIKDIKEIDTLMADAMDEYSQLPSDEKEAATHQEKENLKAFIKGVVSGIKQGIKTHKAAQKEIREYIKINLQGKFSLSAVRQLVHAVGMITDDASLQAQMAVIDRIIDSARYARLVDEVKAAISKMKRQAKPQLADRIRDISPLALDESDLINLKQAVNAMNMQVPSYALAESIIASLEAKNQAYQSRFAPREKTIEDIQKALDTINKDINNVDDYRKFLNALRSFVRTADVLLREGKITIDEYNAFMQSVFDADNNLLANLHDKINSFREELADDILSVDISGYTPTKAEEPFFRELESLRKEHLLKLSPLTLSLMLEVKERIAIEGFVPMEQLSDVIVKALSEMGSKKLTKQFESTTLKDKGIEYLRLLLSSKEKTFWTRILGVKGMALYDTILNPIFRAIEQRKRLADSMFSDMFKKLEAAGFMGMPSREKTKAKYKVAMFFHYMGERGLRGVKDKKTKVAPDRVGFRDIFGGLIGSSKEREDYTEAQRKRADDQWAKYSPYDREIIKEIYDELMAAYGTPDGRIDLDKMEADFEASLSKQEKALYQIHKEVTAQLEDYQRVANAITKKEFNPVEGYIMRDYIDTEYGVKDDFDFAITGLNKVAVESSTGKERTTNDPMAVNLDIKELLIKGIQRTTLHYALSFANNVAHNTVTKSGIRSDIKSALRAALKDMLLFEYYFSNTNKIITNITNSAAYLSLVSIPRTIAEAVITPISSLLILAGLKGGGISIITQYSRSRTLKLMEETNSTLLDKLKLKGEKNFELKGSREFEKIGKLKRIGHAAVSVSESIAMPAWYALFRSEFKNLTGLDYNKVTDSKKYWQEVKQAASYADMEMKQITGGGIKAEGRERIQVFYKPVISEKRLSVLGREFKTGNIPLSVRRDTPVGKMFGFLQEYPFRDSERLFGAIRNMGNAPVRESMRITGTLMNMLGYGMAAAFTRLLWQWLFASASGDDERKDEIESALQKMLEPKYYVENAVGTMVQTAGIRMSGAGRAANIILASVLYNTTDDEEQKNMIADFVEREYYSPVVGGQYSRFVKSELNDKTRKIQSTTDFVVNLNPVIRFVSDMAGQFVDRHGGVSAASEAIDEIMWKIENGHEVDPLDAEFLILYNNLINITNTVLISRGVQLPETRSVKRELKNIIKNSEFIESIEK